MQSTDSPSFIITCEEDDEGNLILPFPEELLEAVGWTAGTTLDIGLLPGTIILREVERVPESAGTNGGTQSVTQAS